MKLITKTLLGALALTSVGIFGATVAAQGEVIGNIYSTDILAYVNGQPAESYNIGGKTAVIIEDLHEQGLSFGYGFSCDYNDAERTLSSEVFQYKNVIRTERRLERGQVGEVVGSVYDTDIRVFINGREVNGYNIGGKTAVCIEDLGTFDGTSPNEQYGYSKYLCNFEWNADDRIVKLNAIEGLMLHDIDVPSIKYLCNDNVLTAEYNIMNNYQSWIYPQKDNTFSNTEKFSDEKYVLHPLYLKTGEDMTQIGLCFVDYRDITELCITEKEKAEEILNSLIGEPISYDEAMKMLDDGVNYKLLDKLELEDYTFAVSKKLYSLDEWETYSDVVYAIAAKSGGVINVRTSSTSYTTRTLEKIGENKVRVIVAPFGGPHGATSMQEEYDCSYYRY